ncbi:Hypothetical predicted protein [Pelobates cultripes]|uniref:Uncharacterized protein n=1 Tax=Pelobates cultripes TaxID=61616 RepID=A0AAD1W8D0_PELCU|nr:Hypothetical predicted protein [Pelobates cultripes]
MQTASREDVIQVIHGGFFLGRQVLLMLLRHFGHYVREASMHIITNISGSRAQSNFNLSGLFSHRVIEPEKGEKASKQNCLAVKLRTTTTTKYALLSAEHAG